LAERGFARIRLGPKLTVSPDCGNHPGGLSAPSATINERVGGHLTAGSLFHLHRPLGRAMVRSVADGDASARQDYVTERER